MIGTMKKIVYQTIDGNASANRGARNRKRFGGGATDAVTLS